MSEMLRLSGLSI